MIPNESPVIANSLWTATANIAPDCPPLRGRSEVEVAIVGGGITGLSAALHLAEQGKSVAVLEAQTPGWGASGRNGGQLNPGLKHDPDDVEARFGKEIGARMLRVSGEAPSYAMSLIRRHEISCDAIQPGWLQPGHNPAAMKLLQSRVEQWNRRGAPLRMLSKAEITELTGSDVYIGGLLDERGGNLQPLNYAMGLAEAAMRHGAVVHAHSPVTGLSRDGATHVVKTVGGEVKAGKVLICTNGYTEGLAPPLGRTVVPVRSVQVATAPLSDNLRASILPQRHAASDTRRVMVYYKMDGQGRLLMGGRGDFESNATAALLDNLRKAAREMYPQLGDTPFEYAWGGFVAMTVDHYPHLSPMGDGIMTALGYNGRGVALASVMGRVLADWAGGRAEEELDFPVTPIRPIPFHFLRKTAVRVTTQWFRIQDKLGI